MVVDFFGLGFGEVVLIIVIALIVLGPEKVPEIARGLGRMVRTFRQAASGFTSTITKELDEARKTTSELAKDVTKEMVDASKATSDIAKDVATELVDASKATSDIAQNVTKELGDASKATSDLTSTVTKGLDDVRKSLELTPKSGSPDSSGKEPGNAGPAGPGGAEAAGPREQ